MPRIRITGRLPQAGLGLQTTSSRTTNPDDEWIKKMLEFERNHGDSSYGPLSNFGYNDWKKLGHDHPPASINEAIEYFKKDFLPKLQNYPAGVKERMGDYIFNSGRNPNDLLLLSSGLATLDEVNSNDPNVAAKLKNLYDQNKDKINSVLTKPDFIKSLDNSRDQLFKTTGSYPDPKDPTGKTRIHYSLDNPNPSYGNAWSKRLKDIYGYTPPTEYPSYDITSGTFKTPTTQPNYTTGTDVLPPQNVPASTTNVGSTMDGTGYTGSATPPVSTQQTSTPVVTINGPQAPAQPKQDEEIDYAAMLPNFTKMIGQKYGNKTKTPQTTTDTTISFKRPSAQDEDAMFAQEKERMISEMSPKEKAQYDKENAPLPQYNPFAGVTDKPDSETDAYNAMGFMKQKRFDKGLLGKQDSEASKQQYQKWYNEKYPMSKHGTLREYGRTVGNEALHLLNPIMNWVQNQKAQKEFDNRFAEKSLADNSMKPTSQNESGSRGYWDKNTGIFQPDKEGFKNETMYGAYGGTMPKNNNTMGNTIKIRITGSPEQQKMAYGGQLGYSLNLGAKRLYTDMPDLKSDNVSSTLPPVPRSEANIEAERGETIYGDVDGDGSPEHMVIGGKRHTEGGTPLNAPEGSFIFSDTAKMKIKDPKVLEKFGVAPRKDGWTPAEIAKRYDINKYKAIMEDKTTDPIRKATAQIMIKNYTKKLSELALIQEQMKGFPQGIPDIAKKANPDLKTKEDQNIQPGSSDNISTEEQQQQQQEQQPQPGGEEPNGVQEYPQGPPQPGMAYGGMIPQFALAGQVDDYSDVLQPYTNLNTGNINTASINLGAVGGTSQDVNTGGVFGPGDPNAIDQTYTPKQHASLNDPEYPKFLALLKKADTGKYKSKGAIYINKLEPAEAAEFARLATKFGFTRGAEGAVGSNGAPTWNASGHRIIQGVTSGYGMTDPKTKKQFGFFGGFTPDMYERKVIENVYGKEASDKMTDVERRKAYFKELGVDISGLKDAQLANTKTLYGNQKFFKEKFYPAFTKTFGAGEFRPEMKDDMLIGAEHYDSYKNKPVPEDKTIIGYKCTGRDPNTGQPKIISSSYMDAAHMTADGAVSSEAGAQAQCPVTTTTIVPGGGGGGEKRKGVWDYMTPDKVNFFAAASVPPKKYLPWSPNLPFEHSKVAFEDWRAKAAERQGLMNNMMNQMNTYSPGSATAANLSFLAGQGAQGLVGDIAATDARNVATANSYEQMERQRKDQNNMLNWKQAQDMYNGNVIANQQFDNAQRVYNNDLAKTFGQAWKNRMYLGMLNAVNPVYNVDPRSGYSFFKQGYGTDKFNNTPGAGATTGWASINSDFQNAKQQIPGLTFDQYLRMQGKKSSSDTDMDGIPNSTRTTGYATNTAANAGVGMPAQYVNAFGQTPTGSVGG